jgi:PAS domain S-box-containing protein
MNKSSYEVLLLNDNLKEVESLTKSLDTLSELSLSVINEITLESALYYLAENNCDVVFSVLDLKDSKGLSIIVNIQKQNPFIPIIVIVNSIDPVESLQLIRNGVQDVILKDSSKERLTETIKYSYNRKKNENDLRESNDRFKSIAENIQDGLTIIENDEMVYVNPRMEDITGYTIEELKSSFSGEKENESQLKEFFDHLNSVGSFYSDESVWIKRKNGRRCFLRNRSSIKKINGTKVIKYIATTDITEQWRGAIVKEFVNTISTSMNIVENEKDLFKIIYKEIKKIFFNKEICLGILKGKNTIDFIQVRGDKIVIENISVKDSMCSLLLKEKDYANYSCNEIKEIQERNKIKFKKGVPKSWMGASLYDNDKKHGILVLKDFKNEDAFNKDDLELLKFIAKQITLAIQKNKSEEKIKQLSLSVEQSSACIVITNYEGIIEYVNNAFVDIAGYTSEEVIGETPKILKSGKTTAKTYVNMWETITAGNTWKGVFINKKKSGEIYYEEAKISSVLNHEEKITHFVAIKEDITERIQKEKELLLAKEQAEESESKIKNLLVEMQLKNTEISALLDGAKKILESSSFEETAKILFDHCKKLTGAKAGYVALLSETGEENNVLFLDDGGDNCTVDTNLPMPIRGLREQAYMNKQAVYDNDFNNSDWVKFMPEGHVYMKNVLFAPLVIKNQAVGLIGLANKVTNFTDDDARIVSAFGELASLALFNSRNIEEMQLAKEKAEEGDRLKSSFLANMSHEVRTPMNGIIGFSQFLKMPDLDEENKLRYINIINDSCKQLLTIIEDILEVSKLETGQIEILNQEFEVSDVVNNIYINYQEKAEIKKLKLSYKNELPNRKLLNADRQKVTQILTNLLSNALKFTHDGSIELGAIDKKEYVEFYVKDTGIGIGADIQEKIFERFRQAETTLSRTYGGTGLGLAIAKGYLDLMQGDIWVDSKLEEGSTFYFKLPYKSDHKNRIEIHGNDIFEPEIDSSLAKVLVAEDEEINFQYIKRVFNELGMENIIRAHNGQEAIDICSKEDNIDLIMMDLKMPMVNGFEATKKIKLMGLNIPIIAQTALAIPGDRQKALEVGCDDYISKPIDYDKLLEIIEKYISIDK